MPIRAHVHLLGGYSAHADQAGLLAWVAGLPRPPRQLRLVHGDATAKAMLAGLLRQRYPGTEVLIPG